MKRTNASKHKAMSYGRMEEKDQMKEPLAAAEAADQAEDAQHGARRGNEFLDELRFRKQRLEKIRQAKEKLEAEARAEEATHSFRRIAAVLSCSASR